VSDTERCLRLSDGALRGPPFDTGAAEAGPPPPTGRLLPVGRTAGHETKRDAADCSSTHESRQDTPPVRMTLRFSGKVALITGAARGQGRSHAIRLAEEGADVILVDTTSEIPLIGYPASGSGEMAETAAAVTASGRRFVVVDADVRDLDILSERVGEAVDELGSLDIVSANAGIAGPMGPLVQLQGDEWRQMIDVNLTGVWHTCKVAVPHIRKGERGGSIVLTGSEAGLRGLRNMGHYTAAKHGVLGLMRTLAIELGPEGIRVNSLMPGQVNTPMLMNEKSYSLFRPDLENPGPEDLAVVTRNLNALPVSWVEPSDVTNALLFLVSDEARYITGVALPVDAGWSVL
jgi:(+)-trans-carveol dehydrogenase